MREHVPWLGIVMMVLGGLHVMVYGLFLALSMIGVGVNLMNFKPTGAEAWGELVGTMFAGVMPVGWVLVGVAYLVIGFQVRSFRWRLPTIVVLGLGLIPCCYGHPCCTYFLDICVGVWGLIVLFNSEVASLFAQAQAGNWEPSSGL